MKMKKLAVAVAAAAAIGAPLTASAYGTGVFEKGLLVPWVTHGGTTGDTTVVGLITNNDDDCYDGANRVRVAWVFHNVNSGHEADGQFQMTPNDMYSFNWAGQNRSSTLGKDGYLVFTAQNGNIAHDDPAGCLAGNAFYVDVASADVAFVPTVPLAVEDYVNGVNPRLLDASSIVSLSYGTDGDQYIYMRHFVDGAPGGTDTRIVLWTTENRTGAATVFMYDNDQNDQSGNMILANTQLNVIDPENVAHLSGVDLSVAPDGFITVDLESIAPVAPSANADIQPDAYSFSYVSSTAFGAVQTLINPHTNVDPQ